MCHRIYRLTAQSSVLSPQYNISSISNYSILTCSKNFVLINILLVYRMPSTVYAAKSWIFNIFFLSPALPPPPFSLHMNEAMTEQNCEIF